MSRITLAFAAEATATIYVVDLAVDLGFIDVVIEEDSKAVISKLSSENTDYSEICALIWEAKGKARELYACTYRHIHRMGNKAGHLFATMHNHNEDDRF
ncbi:hypothetical protein F3Y22_tig00111769pilonHSYRG00017 [Hibiscus syriacus]|uniref:RNase H type-1 domain-containing protein n=1 Tax=Hibiscus syriacus TaxID=106335 RepID=A0A6A2XDV8_HIBSY|nr:hypothetical protein F3Y22_tig00111769pilonHSYRG00017 [Hibiscus syriacus]